MDRLRRHRRPRAGHGGSRTPASRSSPHSARRSCGRATSICKSCAAGWSPTSNPSSTILSPTAPTIPSRPPVFNASFIARLALAWQSDRVRGLVLARWLLGARSAQRFRCCWPGDECTRRRGRPDGRGAWRALRLGLGRTRFAGAIDRGLADAAAGHSVADDSRRAATSGNDTMAAADGARTWQGVRSHRAARSQCRRTSRLVVAGH